MASEPAKFEFSLLRRLLYGKLAVILLATLGAFSHPHIIRQVDTMSVSLRYWLRWAIESDQTFPLLPAVLAAGDQSGITPMEFPFMNLLYAPFFALPLEAARSVAWLAHILLCLGLTFLHYREWRGKVVCGIKADWAAALLPLVGITSGFLGRFQPDYFAFILLSLAVAWSWEEPRPWRSGIAASLALLIKPPVVVALALFLLQPLKRSWRNVFWVAPALAVTLLYYLPGLKWIRSIAEFPDYFAVGFRNPIESVLAFVQAPNKIARLFFNDLLAPPYFGVVFIFILGACWKKRVSLGAVAKLGALLLLQVLAVASLDGAHAFIHTYYYIGTSLIATLLVVWALENNPWRPLAYLTLALFFGAFVDRSIQELRPVVARLNGESREAQCAELRRRLQQIPWRTGLRFRSDFSLYPELGLCFGEIQNSARGPYGFYLMSSATPDGCREMDHTAELKVVSCQ